MRNGNNADQTPAWVKKLIQEMKEDRRELKTTIARENRELKEMIAKENSEIKAIIAKENSELKAAITLYFQETSQYHKEAAEDRKQAAEDRKQAAEDRKQAARDWRKFDATLERMEADRKLSDKKFRAMGRLVIRELKEIKQILIKQNGGLGASRA